VVIDVDALWLGSACAGAPCVVRHVADPAVPGAQDSIPTVQNSSSFSATQGVIALRSHSVDPQCPRSCLGTSPSPYYPAMWDDEDNNPYGSFARHDSNTSDVTGLASPTACKASNCKTEGSKRP